MAASLTSLVMTSVWVLAALIGDDYQRNWPFRVDFFHDMSSVAGPAVAGAWIIQAASATMRPEPGWIDRAGAFVGWCWLADFLLILIALNMR